MKIFHITLAVCLLSTLLMAGCRNRTNDTTMPSTTRPSTTATTAPRQTTPSTAPTTMPSATMPSGTMPGTSVPQGTDSTPATNGTDGVLDPGSMMPQRGGGR